jgi:hypothetical protein
MKQIFFIVILLLCNPSYFAIALADNTAPTIHRDAELIGIARASSREPAFDQHLKGELDKLVPRLKKLNKDAAVLIEAYYPSNISKGNDEHVRKAYSLAEQAQLYLRNRHSLSISIFIAIWSGGDTSGDKPQIRLTAYPKTFFEN